MRRKKGELVSERERERERRGRGRVRDRGVEREREDAAAVNRGGNVWYVNVAIS